MTHNQYRVVKRPSDPRSTTGFTLTPFPFGETLEEIAKAGGETVESLEYGIKANPLFHKWFLQMKESGLYSEEILAKGDAAPLGQVQADVVDAATPALVGRQIDSIIRTDDIKVRLYQRKPGLAKKASAIANRTPKLGARYSFVDINVDSEPEESAEWSRTMVEDVPFNVAQDEAGEVGRSVGEQESAYIFNALNTAADDASAQSQALGADTSWVALSKLVAKIWGANGKPDFLAVHGADMDTFWGDATFINNFHFGDQFDVSTGVFGRTYIGLKIIVSNQVNVAVAGEAQIGASSAIKEALRRDLLTEPYQPDGVAFGYRASMRLGVLPIKRYKSGGTQGYYDFGKITGV